LAAATRTCVVGRDEHPRDELVRLVASPDGEVVVDYRARLPGRGVWILPERDRLAQLGRKKGAVEAALHARLDPDAVIASLRDAVVRAALDGLSQAAAGGALVGGFDRLTLALVEGRVDLVATAAGASERTLEGLRQAGPDATFVELPLDTDALGRRVGKGPLAAVGVTSARPAAHLRRQLRRLSRLG
jgi:predicted RNA-binding protein YlxR (DUF448 family)